MTTAETVPDRRAGSRVGWMERTAGRLALATPSTASRITTAVVIAVAFYGTLVVLLRRTDVIESAWYLPFLLVWLSLGYVVGPILGALLTGWYRERPLRLPHERLTWLGTRRYRRSSSWTSPLGAEEVLTQLRQRMAVPSVQTRGLDGGLWIELERDIGSDVDAATMGLRERAAVDVLVIVDETTPVGAAAAEAAPRRAPVDAGRSNTTETGGSDAASRVTVHHGRRRGWTAAPDGGMTARLADQLLLAIRDATGG